MGERHLAQIVTRHTTGHIPECIARLQDATLVLMWLLQQVDRHHANALLIHPVATQIGKATLVFLWQLHQEDRRRWCSSSSYTRWTSNTDAHLDATPGGQAALVLIWLRH